MPGSVSVKIEGMKEVRENLRKYVEAFPKKVKAALVLEAELIMTEAKELCPVDTGALRASGHVVVDPNKIAVQLVFGGPSADYAGKVHEDLLAKHTTGQAKYLEQPLMAAIPDLAKRIAEAVGNAGEE